ncbi:MAG: carboxypeptidase M32 [Rhodothermales bacterium]|nr:carboxypeptidase M32 [Rhodothermales bacterium]
MSSALEQLRERLSKIKDLENASAILEWDQETHMPAAGVEARSRQVSTLRQMAHELFCEDTTADLLAKAKPENDLDKDLLRVVKHDFDHATRLPADLVGEFSRVTSMAREGWKEGKANNDFSAFEPHLAAVLDCNLRKAEALGYEDEPYDALLDEFEPGMKTSEVTSVFEALRKDLVDLVGQIAKEPVIDESILTRYYPEKAQWDLGVRVMSEIGYDFDRGRQDRSAHPFSTTFSVTDSRVTTHLNKHHFNPAFFGSLHEAGHAMYEQGVDPALDGTPLQDGTSLGMHESQSRLWENLVGRSRPFWDHYFPLVQRYFPAALSGVSEGEFYRAVNAVRPSLIRIEADEVTYNLHIMARFELERAMLSGEVKPAQLPEAWNARMRDYLGVAPDTDSEGCLQDIHWSLGAFGYFPTYALGNLMSAQLWSAMERDLGSLEDLVANGEFSPLLGWLRQNVHRHGRRKTATQILEATYGSGLDAGPWMAYARKKFGDLYDVAA